MQTMISQGRSNNNRPISLFLRIRHDLSFIHSISDTLQCITLGCANYMQTSRWQPWSTVNVTKHRDFPNLPVCKVCGLYTDLLKTISSSSVKVTGALMLPLTYYHEVLLTRLVGEVIHMFVLVQYLFVCYGIFLNDLFYTSN